MSVLELWRYRKSLQYIFLYITWKKNKSTVHCVEETTWNSNTTVIKNRKESALWLDFTQLRSDRWTECIIDNRMFMLELHIIWMKLSLISMYEACYIFNTWFALEFWIIHRVVFRKKTGYTESAKRRTTYSNLFLVYRKQSEARGDCRFLKYVLTADRTHRKKSVRNVSLFYRPKKQSLSRPSS